MSAFAILPIELYVRNGPTAVEHETCPPGQKRPVDLLKPIHLVEVFAARPRFKETFATMGGLATRCLNADNLQEREFDEATLLFNPCEQVDPFRQDPKRKWTDGAGKVSSVGLCLYKHP